MIVLLILRSIAFAALFSSPLEWQTKLFLGSALLLIDFHFALLDIQAAENHEIQQVSTFTALAALEKRIESNEAPSLKTALEEVHRLRALKDSMVPKNLYMLAVPLGSYALSIFIGWLLAKYMFASIGY